MGSFSNITLTVNEECGDNLLNPSYEDIIKGIGEKTFDDFRRHGFMFSFSNYENSDHDTDGKLKGSVILKELRKEVTMILGDFEEKDGDRCFIINEIKDGCVEEDIINYILDKHGNESYLEVIESIDYGDIETRGQYIDNAFSNGAEITLRVSGNENVVMTACRKLAEILGEERIGEMLEKTCSDWQRCRFKP